MKMASAMWNGNALAVLAGRRKGPFRVMGADERLRGIGWQILHVRLFPKPF